MHRSTSLGLALLTGCAVGSPGELGLGTFAYLCTDKDADAACADEGGVPVVDEDPVAGVPAQIAVGTEFVIEYTGQRPTEETADGAEVDVDVFVQVASPTLLGRVGDGAFYARRAGDVAVIGMGVNGVIADYLHLSAVEPDQLAIIGPSDRVLEEAIEMATDGHRQLSAEPRLDDTPLAGTLHCAWESSHPAMLSVSVDDLPNGATIEALGEPGTLELSVVCGEGLSTTLDVTIGSEGT